jgi:hypothetical protein
MSKDRLLRQSFLDVRASYLAGALELRLIAKDGSVCRTAAKDGNKDSLRCSIVPKKSGR